MVERFSCFDIGGMLCRKASSTKPKFQKLSQKKTHIYIHQIYRPIVGFLINSRPFQELKKARGVHDVNLVQEQGCDSSPFQGPPALPHTSFVKSFAGDAARWHATPATPASTIQRAYRHTTPGIWMMLEVGSSLRVFHLL